MFKPGEKVRVAPRFVGKTARQIADQLVMEYDGDIAAFLAASDIDGEFKIDRCTEGTDFRFYVTLRGWSEKVKCKTSWWVRADMFTKTYGDWLEDMDLASLSA